MPHLQNGVDKSEMVYCSVVHLTSGTAVFSLILTDIICILTMGRKWKTNEAHRKIKMFGLPIAVGDRKIWIKSIPYLDRGDGGFSERKPCRGRQTLARELSRDKIPRQWHNEIGSTANYIRRYSTGVNTNSATTTQTSESKS